ncbi:beta-N-acetylhexosaminidase [Kineosporia sp. NBRC 101731]|nr:beta-N-acetylhexosaminidase [Kineosporia sp. NBRC 101731]
MQSAVEALSPAERAGQLVMAGTPLTDADSVVSVMRKNHLGSVFLHGRSGRSAAGLKQEINRLPSVRAGDATIEPLVSIDQEGGAVQSLRGGRWGTLAKARVQGTWSTARLSRMTGIWAKQLSRAGITMDLAPVADTVPSGTERRNPPIGVFGREYGTDTTTVSRAITTVTTALEKNKVIATVKHFPGLGRVTKNTDTSSGVVDTRTTANDAYLRPFQAGIDAGAGAVMISSATYRRIDPDNRAVFSSKVITDLLREQMGYQGVVMTDDVGAAKAVTDVAAGQRAVRFINAGGDLVLTVPSDQARTMMVAITKKAAVNKNFSKKVDASVTRVLTLKQKAGLLTCGKNQN